MYYFGNDKEKALARYVAEWPEITANRARTPDPAGLIVVDLVNQFLTRKLRQVERHELHPEVLTHYRRTCATIIATLGRTRAVASIMPPDFGRLRDALAVGLSPTTLAYRVRLARTVFNYGGELLDKRVRYGDQFAVPAKRVMRLHRETRGRKFIEAVELRRLLDAADVTLRAQILLGVNCAFGATDLSELRDGHIRDGWVVLPRRKTGSARRCPLWPETATAIEAARKARPRPADKADCDRLFLSGSGRPLKVWVPAARGQGGQRIDSVGESWRKLVKAVGVKVPKGTGFYVLRHIFRTVADEVHDRPAIDLIMGHGDPTQADAYRERISDERLINVAKYVNSWLFSA